MYGKSHHGAAAGLQIPLAAARKEKKGAGSGRGPAGMEQQYGSWRGHMVTLVEKAGRLGGNLHPAAAPFFKKDIEKLCMSWSPG